MRYQKLESQEANWKWKYLLKKYREGENITKHEEQRIKAEMTAEQRKKMRQSIRARRKRFFNAEKLSTRKKSIDLEYASWLSLSKYAKSQGITLSEAVNQLIDEVENQDIYREQIAKMKSSISELLK